MKVVVITPENGAQQYQVRIAPTTILTSSKGSTYKASEIYCVEIDYIVNETLVYVPGEVVEFGGATEGEHLLSIIEFGEHITLSPSEMGEIDDD